jgi:hypothetical protein
MMRAFVLVLGLGCTFPIELSASHIRLSDISMAMAAIGTLAIIPTANFTSRQVRLYFLIVALTMGWIWAELQYREILPHDLGAAMILVRWVFAIPASYFLCVLAENAKWRKSLFTGMILGLLIDTSLLGYDYISFQITGKPAFVWNRHVWYANDAFRASGIEGGPNAAAAGADFVVPFLLGAAEEFRWKWWPVGLATAVAAFAFVATESRGAFVSSICLLAIWAWTTRPRALVQICFVAVLASLVYATMPMFIPSAGDNYEINDLLTRFTNSQSMAANADRRVMTIVESIELALQNPLGMGSSYGPALAATTGYEGATHNGLVQIAVLGGLPLAGVVAAVLVIGGRRIFGLKRRTENWVAAYILCISFFEAFLFGPYVPLLLLWAVGSIAGSSEKIAVRGRLYANPQ